MAYLLIGLGYQYIKNDNIIENVKMKCFYKKWLPIMQLTISSHCGQSNELKQWNACIYVASIYYNLGR